MSFKQLQVRMRRPQGSRAAAARRASIRFSAAFAALPVRASAPFASSCRSALSADVPLSPIAATAAMRTSGLSTASARRRSRAPPPRGGFQKIEVLVVVNIIPQKGNSVYKSNNAKSTIKFKTRFFL